jgi:hypothetical protein
VSGFSAVRRRYLSEAIPFKNKNRIFLWKGSKKTFFSRCLSTLYKRVPAIAQGFAEGIKLLVYPEVEGQRENRCVAGPERTDTN